MPGIQLKELAIHVVLRQLRGTHLSPKLSQGLTPLDRETSQFLESKFVQAFDEANDIVRMDNPSSPTPDLIHRYHTGEIPLLELSQALGDRLQIAQTGATSDGLLLVGHALRDSEDVLVVAKMEHERGARAEPVVNSRGESVYQIELLNDLFLTAKTRVFKVAVFDRRCANLDTFRGRLADSQVAGRDLADYFLHDFLGCERARKAEVLTKSFFRSVNNAVRSLPPQDRAQVHVAMMTHLLSNATQVRVREFAADHVPREIREDFLSTVEAAGVPNVFLKDTALISGDLSAIQVSFENGSILYSLPDQIGETVLIEEDRTSVVSRASQVGPARKRLSQVDRFPDVPTSDRRPKLA